MGSDAIPGTVAGAAPSPPGVVTGAGGLPELLLVAPDGALAEIYVYGGHVLSWIPNGDGERLFLSARSRFAAGAAIRGGVPVIFPQFDDQGPLPRHGFARVSTWELAGTNQHEGTASATLRLTDSPATRALWPHPFMLELTVTVGGADLLLDLSVTNTGGAAFTFTTALHSYLRVSHVRQLTVEGLAGVGYRDKVAGGVLCQPEQVELRIDGETDRVYANAPDHVVVRERNRTTAVSKSGFPDVVIWNPGETGGKKLADLDPLGHIRMLCVEAGAVAAPVRLGAGARWSARQALSTSRQAMPSA